MRFLLVDKVLNVVPGKSIRGVKCWTLTDEIFFDHFPGFPIVPGVLLIESMAQLAGFLIEETLEAENPAKENKPFGILSLVHKAKFHKFVAPGDKCDLSAEIITLDTMHAHAMVQTQVDGELMAKADLSFILVTIEELSAYGLRRQEYRHVTKLTANRRKEK